MRQIILDTETTGLEPKQGHRIIEIGCVELDNRRLTKNNYHQYLQPEREIDVGAMEVHGITNEFLKDKPLFSDVVDEFMDFIKGAELIIHNAPFDVGFINSELSKLNSGWDELVNYCKILDTLVLARKIHPGQKNSLDALCKRYEIDNSQRTLHGALLDAEILADVYLVMTGGQANLLLDGTQDLMDQKTPEIKRINSNRPKLKVIRATDQELSEHASRIEAIDKASNGKCVWKQ